MIFLSAQPGTQYFLWQLDILVFNLFKLKVSKEHIHILLSYGTTTTDYEINQINAFKNRNQRLASIFIYEDTRKTSKYASSLRPHLIAKHLATFPSLENEVFFYHDSDILFRDLPNIHLLEKGSNWYVADTRSYLGYKYLQTCLSPDELNKMCQVVGIGIDIIRDKDQNAGGAQYVLKNTSIAFWHRVENQCEQLYEFLSEREASNKYSKQFETNKKQMEKNSIQAWCTDMWVILWNAWLDKINVKIHDDLNFCWPTDNLKQWYKTKILHYSGKVNIEERRYFRKSNFLEYPPYFDIRLNEIDDNTCSFPLKQAIHDFKKENIDVNRENLLNTAFILLLTDYAKGYIEKMKTLFFWIDKTFNTKVLVIDKTNRREWFPNLIHQEHIFLVDKTLTNRKDKYSALSTKKVKEYIKKLSVENMIVISQPYIIDTNKIIQIVERFEAACQSYMLFDLQITSVDSIFTAAFSKFLDYKVISFNVNKFKNTYAYSDNTMLLIKAGSLNKDERPIFNKNENSSIDAFLLTSV